MNSLSSQKIRAFPLPKLESVQHLLDLTQERRQEIMDELAEKDVLKKQKEKDETAREIAKRQKMSVKAFKKTAADLLGGLDECDRV